MIYSQAAPRLQPSLLCVTEVNLWLVTFISTYFHIVLHSFGHIGTKGELIGNIARTACGQNYINLLNHGINQDPKIYVSICWSNMSTFTSVPPATPSFIFPDKCFRRIWQPRRYFPGGSFVLHLGALFVLHFIFLFSILYSLCVLCFTPINQSIFIPRSNPLGFSNQRTEHILIWRKFMTQKEKVLILFFS